MAQLGQYLNRCWPIVAYLRCVLLQNTLSVLITMCFQRFYQYADGTSRALHYFTVPRFFKVFGNTKLLCYTHCLCPRYHLCYQQMKPILPEKKILSFNIWIENKTKPLMSDLKTEHYKENNHTLIKYSLKFGGDNTQFPKLYNMSAKKDESSSGSLFCYSKYFLYVELLSILQPNVRIIFPLRQFRVSFKKHFLFQCRTDLNIPMCMGKIGTYLIYWFVKLCSPMQKTNGPI